MEAALQRCIMPSPSEEGEGGPLAVDEVFPCVQSLIVPQSNRRNLISHQCAHWCQLPLLRKGKPYRTAQLSFMVVRSDAYGDLV